MVIPSPGPGSTSSTEMPWAYGQRVVGGSSEILDAASPSWTFSLGSAVALGALAALHIACADSSRLPSSVTDDAGNTWTIDPPSVTTGPGGPASVIARSVITHALTTSNVITVTLPFSGATTRYFAYTVDTFVNTSTVSRVRDGGATNAGTATAISTGTTPAPSSAGDLCLVGFAVTWANAVISGLPSGYTALASVAAQGPIMGQLAYNLSVTTPQNVTATLSGNAAWAVVAQLYAGTVLGTNYPIELDASVISMAASLAIHRGYARPALVATVSEHAALAHVKSRILATTTSEAARLTKVLPPKRLSTTVSMNTALSHGKGFIVVLTTSVSFTASLRTTKIKRLPASVQISVVSLRGVPGKIFMVRLAENAGLNKKHRTSSPPAVLELYDLIDPYQLPNLKGATVAYMHGIFGAGVMFDIYAAYILAGGAFYVADNGLKQALNQHPAVARVF